MESYARSLDSISRLRYRIETEKLLVGLTCMYSASGKTVYTKRANADRILKSTTTKQVVDDCEVRYLS